MFQFQKNADGSFKAFTFTPCDTSLFPSGIRCYKNNDFQQYPLMLKRSYISKIDIRQLYLSNKEDGQTFCIIITDGSNDIYTFEFRKKDFCSEYTVRLPQEMYNKENATPNEVIAKQYLEFLIQTIFDDRNLYIEIENFSETYDVLIKRS